MIARPGTARSGLWLRVHAPVKNLSLDLSLPLSVVHLQPSSRSHFLLEDEAVLRKVGHAHESRERWRCVNLACGCHIVVEISGEIEGQNPRCACGRVIKKEYPSPVFTYLDFPRADEPASPALSRDQLSRTGISRKDQAQSASAFAVRGRTIRTFASLALVLGIGLGFLRVYLIADEFRNPL